MRNELAAVMEWMARSHARAFVIVSAAAAVLTAYLLPIVALDTHSDPYFTPLAPMLLAMPGFVIGSIVGRASSARSNLSNRLPLAWTSHFAAGIAWMTILSLPCFLVLGFHLWQSTNPIPLIRSGLIFIAAQWVAHTGFSRTLFHYTPFVRPSPIGSRSAPSHVAQHNRPRSLPGFV